MALHSSELCCNIEITGHDTKRILHYRSSLKRIRDAGWRRLLTPSCVDVSEQNKSGDPPLNPSKNGIGQIPGSCHAIV